MCFTLIIRSRLVRRLPKDEQQAALTTPFELPLRVLLVTARPEDAGFVDPRSISHELVDELQRQSEAGTIELEFLRPPTFTALRNRLKNTERPIHVLHFDGHGGVVVRSNKECCFLKPTLEAQSCHSKSSGTSPAKSGVRLAVLTACQSAMDTEDDAFSSVSTQLIDKGVDAVIAMSSSILVTSAALYVEAFYHALAEGLPVSIAQEQARQALHKDPHRHLFSRRQDEEAAPVMLADWWIPHFYQQRPLTLHATTAPRKRSQQITSAPTRFNDAMPSEPRYHFRWPRTGIASDRAPPPAQHLVVLSGFGGVGKTALAREAADWLTRTGMYSSLVLSPLNMVGRLLILSELGRFLGVNDGQYNPSDVKTALDRLKSALATRSTLLIADNLESLLLGGEAFLDLAELHQCWHVLCELATLGIGILLTSRNSLSTEDQHIVGSQVATLHLTGLTPDDAYALATRLLEDLSIDRTHAPYTELCDLLTQLDYHPLAIQLILPTLREQTLDTIRADFSALLPTFKDDSIEGRNRSLLASLNYSLSRLSDIQRAQIHSLAVFENGATEDDLLHITGITVPEWNILRSALEQAALLTPEAIVGWTAPFFRFHPVLVPYLRSIADAVTDDLTLLRTFAMGYVSLAEILYEEDKQQPVAMRALVFHELPNLRRALTWLLETGDLEWATKLVHYISKFLTDFGMLRERDTLYQRLAKAQVERKSIVTDNSLTLETFLQESALSEIELDRANLSATTTRLTSLLTRIQAEPPGTILGLGSYIHAQHVGPVGTLSTRVRAAKRLRRIAAPSINHYRLSITIDV